MQLFVAIEVEEFRAVRGTLKQHINREDLQRLDASEEEPASRFGGPIFEALHPQVGHNPYQRMGSRARRTSANPSSATLYR